MCQASGASRVVGVIGALLVTTELPVNCVAEGFHEKISLLLIVITAQVRAICSTCSLSVAMDFEGKTYSAAHRRIQ